MTIGTENGAPIELHYEDYGSGKPVVLIHGWPLSGRSWENQVAPLVEAGRRVITYDRRGFGNSSQAWHGYDYDTFAGDLDGLLRQLDLRDVTLVGFSMGGGEVVHYLGVHGEERVEKAVLAAAVPPFLYKSDDNPDGGLDDDAIAAFENGVRNDRLAFLEEFTTNFFSANGELLVSEPQRVYAREIAAFASPKGTLDCIRAFGRTDFRPDLAKITVPVLVIHGDADAIVPFEVSGQRSAEAIADSELVVIEGGPHAINASHVQQFNDALIAFLNRGSPTVPTSTQSDSVGSEPEPASDSSVEPG
jgi:pimeloyl-ACP methyl ester carboxylesterase